MLKLKRGGIKVRQTKSKQDLSYASWYAAILRNVVCYWKIYNTPLVIVAWRTAMEGMKRKRENKQRDEIFLASPSQSQMAHDSGLFCVRVWHKDGRTILFVVINWLLVGDKVHSALTWRRVLTQRRRRGKKNKQTWSHLLSSVSAGRENNRQRPWHLKTNTVSVPLVITAQRLSIDTGDTSNWAAAKKQGGPRRSYTWYFID